MADKTDGTDEYPEHEKLHKVKDQAQAIGEFLDWLPSKGYTLCEWFENLEDVRGLNRFLPSVKSITGYLSEYFGIDQDKLEAEKQQMLKRIRERQGEQGKR